MFRKDYLDNSIPVVMEPVHNVCSVALGVWVKVGSRYEKKDKNGISHFLEHMFFKGTRKRNTRDIAIEIDSMGGDLNAFTSRENTAFYIKVLDEYLEKGLELLSDILVNSVFPDEEVEKEKKIIKEEIKMVEDTPDDYIHDLFNQTIWGNDGLGQTILGKRETLAAFTRGDIVSHVRKYYGTRDMVISCAGNFMPEKLMKMLNNYLGGLRQGSEPKKGVQPEFRQNVKVYPKELSEAHICIGVPGLSNTSDDRYALYILNTILGAGVSSRLFQEIRERRGLAYSIYSFMASYIDSGLWGVCAGISKKKVREATGLVINEMMGLKKSITEAELERAKKHLKGNLILSLESTNSRMNNIARQEICFGRYFSPKEMIKSIEMVSMGDMQRLAGSLLNRDRIAITAYGPLQEDILNGIL